MTDDNSTMPDALTASSPFRALHHSNYRLFFLGQFVSFTGTWMQNIALRWLIYSLTGSVAMLGIINMVAGLPLVPLSLWGGSLADRLSKRSILLVTQSVMMLSAFILATLALTGIVNIWHVLILAVVTGAASVMDLPARQAIVVDMVGKEDLPNAIGLNTLITNVTRVLGPALGGLVVATIGAAGAFFANGVSFIAVIVGLLLMRFPLSPPRSVRQPKVGAHVWGAVQYVRNQKNVLVLISMVGFSAFLSMPYTTLLPVFAKNILNTSAQPLLTWMCSGTNALFDCQSPDALTYGLLMGAMGLGAMAGAFWIASLPTKSRRGHWLTWGNLCFPILLMGLAWSRSFVLSLILLLGIGFSFIVQNALAATLLQMTVPDDLRGRVMGFYALVLQGMQVVGGVQAGLMGDSFGAPFAVGLGAVVCLVYGLFVAWRFPTVREMN